LDASESGRAVALPIGTLIFLRFPEGAIATTISPTKGVLEVPDGIYHLPEGVTGVFRVIGQGTATMKVTKKIRSGAIINSANNSANWSGYQRTGTSGSFTDIESYWAIPTALCGSTDTFSSAWIGIDGITNSSLIQTGTESHCINGSPLYRAWWEILPDPETVVCTVDAGH